MYTLVVYVKKKLERTHWLLLYFVLSLTGLLTLSLLHCTSLKPLTCQYIQFSATLSSHHIWVPECFRRKITKYKTLQIVVTINPWLASWIWVSVMPGNPISFSLFSSLFLHSDCFKRSSLLSKKLSLPSHPSIPTIFI